MDKDLEHLRLLSIFHYIVGGLIAAFGGLIVLQLVIFTTLRESQEHSLGIQGMPDSFPMVIVPISVVIVVIICSVALAAILAGRFLGRQSHYAYCFAIAAIECLFMPLGTVLGVFTIIVLNRSSVKSLFERRSSGAA